MRIQNNIMAMNAYRNYTTNNSALGKNLEKLSSGYKINRAGDDAAGLAISEKMRAQITGLDVAQKNAQDGISLVQTAEGALTEVHDMLNRMVELATQSANGTYENEVDRENLQSEVSELMDEIDRISETANFNGIELLDGSLSNTQTAKIKVGTVELTATAGKDFGTSKVKFATAASGSAPTAAITATGVTISMGKGTNDKHTTEEIQKAVRDAAKAIIEKGTAATGVIKNAQGLLSFTVSGGTISGAAAASQAMATATGAAGSLVLQIGDSSADANQLKLQIGAMSTAALGLAGLDISSPEGAKEAIDLIKTAINSVSKTRGTLGANQNRLEHTINNLSVMEENITNAESSIRDTDVAEEMMSYTKNNILIQSAQAMLAQANQVPQGVLQLLQ